MILQVFSVLDRGASAHGPILCAVNETMMRRAMVEMIVADRGQSNLSRYPDEFDVYLIGEFDTDNGVLVGRQPEMKFRVAELVKAKEE